MTSQGHHHAIFRHAITRRNVAAAWAAAHELKRVGLADALDLILLLRDREQRRYPRAATRWLARYLAETPGLTIEEAALVASHLNAITGANGRAAGRALAEFLDARGQRPLAEPLRRWQVG